MEAKRIPVLTLGVMLLIAATACGGEVPVAKGYVTKDSGYELEIQSGAGMELQWVDKRFLLFKGEKPGDYHTLPDGRRLPWRRVYLWDTEKGTVERYRNSTTNSSLCVSRGYIRMKRDRVEQAPSGERPDPHRDVIVVEGLLGQESERKSIAEPEWERLVRWELLRSDVACEDFPAPAGHDPKQLKMLQSKDEFFDLGPDVGGCKRTGPVRYFPGAGRTPVDMPFTRNDIVLSASYVAFLDSYVFKARDFCVTRLARDVSNAIWIIDRSGRARKEHVPPGEWADGSVRILPAQEGLVMHSYAGRDANGLYFVKGEKVERIVAGYVETFAVSPDGCKVAAAARPLDHWRQDVQSGKTIYKNAKVIVVDVCAKGGK